MAGERMGQQFLKENAGTFQAVESNGMWEALPKDRTIVAAGGSRKDMSVPAACYVCRAECFLDVRDEPFLRGLKLCILCPTCFFAAEPKTAEG